MLHSLSLSPFVSIAPVERENLFLLIGASESTVSEGSQALESTLSGGSEASQADAEVHSL